MCQLTQNEAGSKLASIDRSKVLKSLSLKLFGEELELCSLKKAYFSMKFFAFHILELTGCEVAEVTIVFLQG